MSTETPLAAVHQYIDSFNRADTKSMAATFDVTGQILDGLPPHAWQGQTATLDWYKDVMMESEILGAADYFVTLGDPLHNNATNDRAYIVVPATMSFDFKGTKVVQSGAVFTLALRKTVDGWRIVSWAWAKGANNID
jgi:hypothetical protein